MSLLWNFYRLSKKGLKLTSSSLYPAPYLLVCSVAFIKSTSLKICFFMPSIHSLRFSLSSIRHAIALNMHFVLLISLSFIFKELFSPLLLIIFMKSSLEMFSHCFPLHLLYTLLIRISSKIMLLSLFSFSLIGDCEAF